MNISKNVFSLIAVTFLLLGFTLQANACGGNQCIDYVEAGGAGQSDGWYNATGNSANNAGGNIIDRVNLSESAGQSVQSTAFVADTCGGGDCDSFKASVSGDTSAYQKNYSFISSDGGGASSSAVGDAVAGNAAASAAYRIPSPSGGGQ